ncbi:hypothetical protein [Haladaptatus sp. DFWS20]|uniref:hypothetical protein n=1 Tax=Haladaptatus sp. DFWS20 TaxID=3403467 RepID=UPI003EBF554F
MNSRTLLAGFPVVMTTIAGWVSVGALTAVMTDSRAPPISRGNLDKYDPGMSIETVVIGWRGKDASPPHTIGLWNAGIRFRTVAVIVTDSEIDEAVLDTTFELPIDSAMDIAFYEPTSYDVTIRVWDTGAEELLRVPLELFDCNQSGTQIGVFDSGDIHSVFFTTQALCDFTSPGTDSE